MIWEAEADASAIRLDSHRKLESILKTVPSTSPYLA